MMVIHFEQLDEDIWGDEADEKITVLSTNYLTGYELNNSSNIITLYVMSTAGVHNLTIDFHRGAIDKKLAKQNYENAITYLNHH